MFGLLYCTLYSGSIQSAHIIERELNPREIWEVNQEFTFHQHAYATGTPSTTLIYTPVLQYQVPGTILHTCDIRSDIMHTVCMIS